jgi:hypothetical protein
MRNLIFTFLPSLLIGAAACAHPLTCPATSPIAWGIPGAPLRTVLVLSQPAGRAVNEDALPIMVPTREWRSEDALYQSWTMNADAPKFRDMIDCLYDGSERHLRLDASKVKQCTLSTPVNKDARAAPSLILRCE